jgi:DNA-binding IclR family transcriptional regulator
LERLAAAENGLSSGDLLDQVGGSRSGLYALLGTLRSANYVVTIDGRHHPGPAIRSLVPAQPASVASLVDAFRSETADPHRAETLALTWPDGNGTVVVAEAPGSGQLRVSYPAGSSRGGDRADCQVMAAGAVRGDDGLDQVRRMGLGEFADAEIVEMATPVCRDGVNPIAAVVAGVPSDQCGDEMRAAVTGRLRQLAVRLSYRVGATVYQPYGWDVSRTVGPAVELTQKDLNQFLGGLWSAQLACVRSDGSPHVVPLWYEWDGSHMWLAASPGASWREHIAANDTVSVTLDEPWPPLRRAFIAGSAHEVRSADVPGGLEGLRRRLANRYLGKGAGERPELVETDGWAAVRLDPTRVHGRQGLGSSAA